MSRSFYEIASRVLAQLHDKCLRSSYAVLLTANEKSAEGGIIKPEMADFHRASSIDDRRTLATDMARRTLNGQAEDQTAGRAPGGQVPNSKKGHQLSTRFPNSHEGTDSGQRALSSQECAWKSGKWFALDICHSYFWPFYAILSH